MYVSALKILVLYIKLLGEMLNDLDSMWYLVWD